MLGLRKRDIVKIFGVSVRKLERSWLQPAANVDRENVYNLEDVVRWYREITETGKEAMQARKLQAEADMAELERNQKTQAVIDVRQVGEDFGAILGDLRDDLVRIPGEAIARGLDGEDSAWLQDRIVQALADAADRAENYAAQNMGGANTAPPESDAEPVG